MNGSFLSMSQMMILLYSRYRGIIPTRIRASTHPSWSLASRTIAGRLMRPFLTHGVAQRSNAKSQWYHWMRLVGSGVNPAMHQASQSRGIWSRHYNTSDSAIAPACSGSTTSASTKQILRRETTRCVVWTTSTDSRTALLSDSVILPTTATRLYDVWCGETFH